MGLLDDVFNSPQGQLGIGLLAAAGPSFTPMGIGQRLAQAQQFMRAQRDNEQMGKLRQAQLDDTTQQVELRKQQAAQLQRKSEMLQNWLGQLDNPTQANAAVLSQTGNLAPTNANAAVQTQALRSGGNVLAGSGISPDAIRADLALNEGKNVPEWLFKRTTPDIQVSNGYAYDKNSTQPGFLPGMQTSANGTTTLTMPDGQGGMKVVVPQGAVEAATAFADASEQSKAKTDLVKVYNPVTKREEYRPRWSIVAEQPAPNTKSTGGFTGDTPTLRDAISSIASPQDKADATFVLNRQYGNGNVAAPSSTEKLASEAGGQINTTWLKSSYEPVIANGQSAQGLIDSTAIARNALRQMGGSGWGTEAKAAAANVLAGLGVAPKNMEFYAANAQVFNNTAATRLWNVLNAAKGPQTEGDAVRAKQTFAQLSNTPAANEFILDLTQASAERDKAKATFYSNALPIARDKGDLSEVDREWSKRVPSIFDMPTMQKWKAKK